ncbi:diguanylate cyclase domain-containing protein [Glaciecola sp. 2405UD65-10]|uniref:GGDEF domain-containing protein n=1 Tax=Glaciecola sp. 2405UD65-10 TaxID=3397244 RepID=UPI003B59DC61
MKCFLQVVFILTSLCFMFRTHASTPLLDVNEFIATSYTPAYDCPSSDIVDTIDQYLTDPSLSQTQIFELLTRKSHALICSRDYAGGQSIVQEVLASESADRNARYYLAAIYQYGFVYDVQENPERCNYYMLAKDSAVDKYLDIKTSASLNYELVCNRDPSVRLANIYQLLEDVTRTGDKAALAHAHNTVGMYYADMRHHNLAAEQYMKALEYARDVYTDENRLTIQASALTVLMASYKMNAAEEVLNEFIEINKNVNTVQTNFLQYYLEAGFYIRTGDYAKLEQTIEKWNAIKSNFNDTIAQGLFSWYAAELCLYSQDNECLQDFLVQEKEASRNYLNYVKLSKDYLRFKVRVYIQLLNREKAQEAFDEFYEHSVEMTIKVRDLDAINDVAEFQDKIGNLTELLAEKERQRNQIIAITVVVFGLVIVGVAWLFRRKLIHQRSLDTVTGLLNNTAVIDRLLKLPEPSPKHTNALAIFDIDNFTEVNLTLGASKGDFVLQQIANTFEKITRSSDILGVFGPGQFILCLADIDEDAAQAFFERVKDALTHTFAEEHGNGHKISVDSSMSIYYATESFSDINEILDNMLLSLSMKSQ